VLLADGHYNWSCVCASALPQTPSSAMLSYKRKRAISPTPSSEPYFVVDEPRSDNGLSDDRGRKRQRTLPPVMDGGLRGMMAVEVDDDGESDLSTEDENTNPGDTDERAAASTMEEYKGVNSLLRDLHKQLQHRIQSPSRQHSKMEPRSITPIPSYELARRQHGKDLSACVAHMSLLDDALIAEERESVRVKEWYEDTNRLLGELVLHRRRDNTNWPEESTKR